jgi:hypothetical protein
VRLGVIKSVETYYENYVSSLSNVTFKEITIEYIERFGGDEFDVIYLIGLPSDYPSGMPDILESYVAEGGGLIFESPNIQGEIELLSSIDSITVSSASRSTYDLAYWTRSGVGSEIYASDFQSSFMVTIGEVDVPSSWSILLSGVETSTLPENTEAELSQYNYDRDAIQEFGISYIVGMKDGLITLEPGEISSSSSNSSSSSSTMMETEWDFCDEIYAYWKLNENNSNSFVWDSSGDFNQLGTFKGGGSDIFTSSKSVSGKVNNAIYFKKSEQNTIEVVAGTKLNFTDGSTDEPFSVAFWLYPLSLSGTQTIISKNSTWKINLSSNKIQMILVDGANTRVVEATSSISVNQWSFIVCTYDGSNIKIYLNTADVSGTQSDTGYSAMSDSSTPLTLGSDASTNWLDALLDNIIVINKVVHAYEIQGMYNRGNGTEDCLNIIAFTSSSDSSSSSIDSSSSSSSEGFSSSSSEGYSSSSSSSSGGFSSSSSSSSGGFSSSSSSSSSSEDYSSSSSQSDGYLCEVLEGKNSYLKAYWPLEESSGNRVDVVNGLVLSENVSSIGSSTGKKDSCALFDTALENNDDLVLAHNSHLVATSKVAISMWSKVGNQSGATDTGGTFGKDTSYYFTVINSALSGGFSAKFSIRQSDTTVVGTSFVSLDEDQFNHFAGIADGSNIYFYINGVSVGNASYDGTLSTSTTNFKLETLSLSSADADHYVDELAVWRDIDFSNDGERGSFVEALYNEGTGNFWDNNLGNWDACTEYASSASSSSSSE